MTKISVADVLRELAKGATNRSETARLNDVINEVEAALAAGVHRSAVLQALHGQGFTMTLKSFESALYRMRKKRVQGTARTLNAPIQTPLRYEGELPIPESDLGGTTDPLTMRQRGEAVADQYMKTTSATSILKKFSKGK